MSSKIKDYIYRPEYETLSRSEMENLQSERLKKTVARVYENCAPYRAKMDELKLKPSDIKSVADLSKLPLRSNTTCAPIILSVFILHRKATSWRYTRRAERRAS